MMNTKRIFNRSNLAKALFPLTLLVSSSVFADTNFSDYCAVSSPSSSNIPDCSAEFQTALLDAVANGEALIMESGAYNIKTFNPKANGITYSAVNIIGKWQGSGGTIIKTRWMRFVDSSVVRISNIRFEGIAGNTPGTSMVELESVNNVYVTGNTFINAGEDALAVEYTSNMNISGNTFEKTGRERGREPDNRPKGTGIALNDVGGTINNNVFLDMFKAGILGDVGAGSTLNITGNQIYLEQGQIEAGNTGVYIDQSQTSSATINLTNNHIHGYRVNGIRINGGGNTVSGNYIYGPGTDAIKAHNLVGSTISNNYLYKSGSGGGVSLVAQGSNSINNVMVSSNQIFDSTAGVSVVYDPDYLGTYSNITIEDNTINNASYAGVRTDATSAASGTIIRNNTITNSSQYWDIAAIRMNRQSSPSITGNNINGQSRPSTNMAHMVLSNTSNGTISNNSMVQPSGTLNTYSGVLFDGGTFDNVGTGNTYNNIPYPGFRERFGATGNNPASYQW